MCAANSESNSGKESRVPKELQPFAFQPGQSGNPNGRPKRKALASMLIAYLQQIPDEEKKKITRWMKRKHKKGAKPPEHYDRAQLLIKELFDRAMGISKRSGSDILMLAILDRVDGKLAPESMEERLTAAPPIIVLSDIPRPDNGMPPLLPRAKSTIDVKPVKPGSNGKK